MKIFITLDPLQQDHTRTAIVEINILVDGIVDIHPNYTLSEPTATDWPQVIAAMSKHPSPSLAEVANALKPAAPNITLHTPTPRNQPQITAVTTNSDLYHFGKPVKVLLSCSKNGIHQPNGKGLSLL